jgi:predicted 3-demethylubiquinone-9 3-methyltransferase (glyoxalase superfamily)
MSTQRIVTNLWFDGNAEEAASFYCSIFDRSRVVSTARYPEGSTVGEPGSVMTVEWELDGQRFVGINGGPQFTFSEAISLAVMCRDQAEVDRFWEALTADGGEEGPCGWCKDRFGLSWQVVPEGMDDVLSGPGEGAQRAFQAMMGMRKIDIDALRRAAEGVPA